MHRFILSIFAMVLLTFISNAPALAQALSPDREAALKPKDIFKECDACPEMVVVPAGSFTMGSPESEKGRDKHEGPQHVVTFRRPFAVGKFEVTVDQFAAFATEVGFKFGCDDKDDRSWSNPGYAQIGSHPVVCVSWDDAQDYADWLSKKTGNSYRLLTEAEWEYAVRARTTPGSGTRYSYGDNENEMCRYGNVADQASKRATGGKWTYFSCDDGHAPYVAPVGSFSANGFGLHDMHGNVLEWTEDCYNDSYRGSPNDGTAWLTGNCDYRVYRGGYWGADPKLVRSAHRGRQYGVLEYNHIGFRVARTLAGLGEREGTQAAKAPVGPDVSIAGASVLAQTLSLEREVALKAKDSFKECDACPEMVVVPAGSFTMGSPESEKGRDKHEGPQRVVTFSQPFAVGKFEVTVDQFATFVKETGYHAGSDCETTVRDSRKPERGNRSWRNPGYDQMGSHPVACLSWNDAKAYAAWLSRKTGKAYRLLTEAEWEYAARARTAPGSETRYSFGDDENAVCTYGNAADQTAKMTISRVKNWRSFACSDGYAFTAPVGSFAANEFGLHDMHGNVWEWTEDCYQDSYRGAPTDGSALQSGNCKAHVLRGGGWQWLPGELRSASRGRNSSGFRFNSLGIRVARALSR